MSPNRNYINGRAFEYKRIQHWKKSGYAEVLRTAGSHGPFDLIAIPKDSLNKIALIQCKRAQSYSQANALIAKFKADPPMGDYYHAAYIQVMDVYVKDERKVIQGIV